MLKARIYYLAAEACRIYICDAQNLMESLEVPGAALKIWSRLTHRPLPKSHVVPGIYLLLILVNYASEAR